MAKYLKVSGLVLMYLLAATTKAQQVDNTHGQPRAIEPTAAVQAAEPTPEPACNPAEYTFLKSRAQDWADLSRYREEDAALPAPGIPNQRVVFLGDSITDVWGRTPDTPPFFPGRPYLNRGIGGQTTPQMLLRFEQDVVHLHPAAVVIMAGTNDVAGNTGPETPQMIEDNFTALTKLAQANGIRVVLASIPPSEHFNWKPKVQPVATIRAVNAWLHDFCASGACTYLDYYSAMSNEQGGMKPGLSKEGTHPSAAGYAVMAPLAEQAIHKALAR